MLKYHDYGMHWSYINSFTERIPIPLKVRGRSRRPPQIAITRPKLNILKFQVNLQNKLIGKLKQVITYMRKVPTVIWNMSKITCGACALIKHLQHVQTK